MTTGQTLQSMDNYFLGKYDEILWHDDRRQYRYHQGILIDAIVDHSLCRTGACFHNNGQTCACLKRLDVHKSIYEAVCGELAAIAKATVVGDGLSADTQLGPPQNKKQLQIVKDLAEDALAHGARFLSGGRARAGCGYLMQVLYPLSYLFTPIAVGDIMSKLNWSVQWNFVFKKTIPFFWIPAHTITFLLSPDFQVLFAAILGVALGVILAMANQNDWKTAVLLFLHKPC